MLLLVLTLNKKHSFNRIKLCKFLIIVLMYQFFLNGFKTLAEENYKLNEIEINSSTKSNEDGNVDFPTNPFEIVDMLRRMNSMSDATNPSDAIDDALKSFDMIKEDNKI